MKIKGFTLIELVMVMVLVAIAFPSLTRLLQQVLFSTNKPKVVSTAIVLAEKEAERVLTTKFSSVVDEHRGAPQPFTGSFSNYSWEVRVTNVSADSKLVEIRVHPPGSDYVRLSFLRTNY